MSKRRKFCTFKVLQHTKVNFLLLKENKAKWMLSKISNLFYSPRHDGKLILFKTLYATNNDMAPSNNWNSPMPGHNPRFDPRKLRDSMKSNLSTVTFLMFTWLGKVKRTMVTLKPLNIGPWMTLVLVVTHGILQLVALLPDNVMSRILRIETNCLILIAYYTHKIV